MRQLRIDQMHVRVRGGVGGDPRAMAQAIAAAIRRGVDRDMPGGGRPIRIDQLSVPSVRIPENLPPAHAQHEIGAQVARSVADRLYRSSRGREE